MQPALRLRGLRAVVESAAAKVECFGRVKDFFLKKRTSTKRGGWNVGHLHDIDVTAGYVMYIVVSVSNIFMLSSTVHMHAIRYH
jgi:hypothetical protein